MLTNLLRRTSPKIEALDLVTRERPPLPSDQTPLAPALRQQQQHELLVEYAQLSASLGIVNSHIDADLKVERFKAFLRMKDWSIFSLPTVVTYMNQKAAEESAAKAGWHWRPLRPKDNIKNARFGTPARAWGVEDGQKEAASDYYHGPHMKDQSRYNDLGHIEIFQGETPSSPPYDKLVPIHALRKVAEVEKTFPDPVSFFVCDYAPAPKIEHPDPFLMAVVDNARLDRGVGRFVIDFWDEPGFGLDQQLT